ncbi:MAG: S8 family serine peptidase [Tabrizicola sp.]|nr:S8 family serine peptidase [Tabrizicola sp.]
MSLRAMILVFLAFCLLHAPLGSGAGGLSPVSAAFAQDDDDGGGDDDDDGGGDDDDDDGGADDSTGATGGGTTGGPSTAAGGDDDPGQRRTSQGAVAATPRPAATVARPAFVRGEIVTLDLADNDLALLIAQGFEVIEEAPVPEVGTLLRRLRVPDGLDLEAARTLVRGLPSGRDADFNHYFRSEEAAAAACVGMNCPSLELIGWTGTTDSPASPACGASAAIGVIDTGINPDHPTFTGKKLTVHRLTDDSLQPSKAVHGTAVTSLPIGDAAGRAPGLLPMAEVIAVDAFHQEDGDERADVFTLVKALDYLADREVRVINLSLAGPANSALEQTIIALTARNVVLVAAAGNGGPQAEPAYPAAYAPVIAVTAVDEEGQVYRRAAQGLHIDLAAPGVNVWTAASVSGEKPKTGTSFAAPFVTAAAAIILEAEPTLIPAEVEARLKAGARDLGDAGSDAVFGAGLIQMPAPCRNVPVSKVINSAGE